GYGDRATAGLLFNDLVRRGEVSAPVAIGRDHLDTGSVASPFRETEAMRDGSDAIADWPILNALLSTASGASWVSVHHGGGVGIGNSIHAGLAVVAAGVERFGGVDALAHIAGGFAAAGTIDEQPVDVWRSQMAINLDTAYFMTRAALRPMRQAGRGSIVYIGTSAMLTPFSGAS